MDTSLPTSPALGLPAFLTDLLDRNHREPVFCEGLRLYQETQCSLQRADDPGAACIQAYRLGDFRLALELAADHHPASMGPWDAASLCHAALQISDLPLASEYLELAATKGLPEAARLWLNGLLLLCTNSLADAQATFEAFQQACENAPIWIADWVTERQDRLPAPLVRA